MQCLGYGMKYSNTQNCLAAQAIEQLRHYTGIQRNYFSVLQLGRVFVLV